MKIKAMAVVSAVVLLFSGCDDEPEAPIPTISQDEQDVLEEVIRDNNQSREDLLNGQSLNESNITSDNLTIGTTLVPAVGSEANDSRRVDSDDTQTLISDNIEYINTQFESIYFDFDRYSIKESMLITVNKNIQLLNNPQVVGKRVVIEGNCDEWGTDEYNYALGLKRAQVVKETLIAEGVLEDRVKVVSYGESNPICLQQKDECWAKNRRVDFKLEEE
jgi:peptidoglycan-associated lipoprotein